MAVSLAIGRRIERLRSSRNNRQKWSNKYLWLLTFRIRMVSQWFDVRPAAPNLPTSTSATGRQAEPQNSKGGRVKSEQQQTYEIRPLLSVRVNGTDLKLQETG